MDRPKRIISKPLRYQTTSSDESPKRRNTASTTSEIDIDKDIDDLRKIGQNMANEMNYFFPRSHTLQNQTSYTRANISKQINEPHTNAELYTEFQPSKNIRYNRNNNQAHTDIQSPTNIGTYSVNSQAQTDIQSHTNIEAHDINSQTYIDFQPHTSVKAYSTNNQTHTDIEPHTSFQAYNTSSQTHTDIQPHTSIQEYNTNSQTHTDIQPHTNIQSCSINNRAHSDIQPHTSIQSCTINNQAHINIQPHTILTNSHTSQNTCAANVSQVSHILHTYPSTHNNTSNIATRKAIYTNDTFFELQDNTATLSPQDSVYTRRQAHQGSAHGQRTLTHAETRDNGRMHSCIERVEAELKRMNTLLEKVLKCVQHRHQPTHKPAILPISSATQMDTFERIDEEGYSDVVNYLNYIGGFNLKEAINLCFKETIKDSLTPLFTWWGREEGRSLYNARLTMAIYEAVCSNQHFQKPTRSEFQRLFREALRTAKERLRHRMRDPRTRPINRERRINLWNDEEPEENAVEQGPTRNDED
ncbi:uncharacterized protein [Polyergus mexicanus]|uniref:uncharacterized protein n=1 Tax=Polyergus mexicanus TaxID=615972 RepID=UPI0038B450A0